MTSPAIHASPTAMTVRGRVLRGLAIGLGAAAVLAYVGAMGTGIAPFGERLAYWSAAILPGSVLGIAFTALVRGWGGLARHPWAEIVTVAVAVAVPHTFVVIVASALFFGVGAITLDLVWTFGAGVLILSLVLTAINHLAAGPDRGPQAGLPVLAVPVPSAEDAVPLGEPDASVMDGRAPLPKLPELLAAKLPPHLRAGRLLAIEAEDHYLRVHTDLGDDLVLMRMSDACAMLPEKAGARVHRSWWVSRTAVVSRSVAGNRMLLKLENGAAAPVSRAMQPVIRKDRWGADARSGELDGDG